jgi:hypothetical protein
VTNKEEKIVRFLQTMRNNPDCDTVEIAAWWGEDLCAIGLKKEDRLVYISALEFFKKIPLGGSSMIVTLKSLISKTPRLCKWQKNKNDTYQLHLVERLQARKKRT